jgi:hypothetical protein
MEVSEIISSLRKEELLERRTTLLRQITKDDNLQTAFKLIVNSGYGAL